MNILPIPSINTNSDDINMLEVRNLNIVFGNFEAVNDLSLEIKSGEVLGILGTNGAGKTSTLKAIAGIISPNRGEIVLNKIHSDTVKNKEIIKEMIGYCPDVGGLITGSTPREHIQLLLNLHGNKELYPVALKLVEIMGLGEFIDTPSGGFSHGMGRRLSVLLAALAADKLLILDEPFDGVDPVGVEAINNLIREAKDSGLAVIVSTHLLSLLVNVSDRVAVMNRGKIIENVPSQNFKGEIGQERYNKILADLKQDEHNTSI